MSGVREADAPKPRPIPQPERGRGCARRGLRQCDSQWVTFFQANDSGSEPQNSVPS